MWRQLFGTATTASATIGDVTAGTVSVLCFAKAEVVAAPHAASRQTGLAVARVPRLTAFLEDGTPVFDSPSGAPVGGVGFFPVRDFRAPYAQQWNLTVQRQLPGG